MKKLIFVFLLTGCGTLEFRPEKTYREKVEDCIEKYVSRYNTNIESTLKVCKEIY